MSERLVYAGKRFDLLVVYRGDEEKDQDAELILVHDGNQRLVIPMSEADELARLLASLPLLLALHRSAGRTHSLALGLLDGHVPPPDGGP